LSKILANNPTIPMHIGGIQGGSSVNITDDTKPTAHVIANIQEKKDMVECNIFHNIEEYTVKVLLQAMINTARSQNERSVELMLSTNSVDHLLVVLSALKELQKEEASIVIHLKLDKTSRDTGAVSTPAQKEKMVKDYKEILIRTREQEENRVAQFQQQTRKPKA